MKKCEKCNGRGGGEIAIEADYNSFEWIDDGDYMAMGWEECTQCQGCGEVKESKKNGQPHSLEKIGNRVLKSKPRNRKKLQNFICSMFQFCTEDNFSFSIRDADIIIRKLEKLKYFKIENNRIKYRELPRH